MSQRIDMSEWLIHFVHERKIENDIEGFKQIYREEAEVEGVSLDNVQYPDFYDEKGEPQYIYDSNIDSDWELYEEASAFSILQRIIHDGFIRSGWSMRNNNPTIYGPTSAVCFTDMPLYALIDYANERGSRDGYVGAYGIAFRKSEMYDIGARSVIYGLSTRHREADDTSDPNFGKGMRTLSSSCGIGLNEQYRYVATQLGNNQKKIDWTFEREWRWPLYYNRFNGIAGIPFLLDKMTYGRAVGEFIIIVKTQEEKREVLDQLLNMLHSKSTNYGYEYDLAAIQSAKVIAIEDLKDVDDIKNVKLDDISFVYSSTVKPIIVNPVTKKSVNAILESVVDIYKQAYDEFHERYPDFVDYSGFISHAKVCTYDITEITQSLFEDGKAYTFSDSRYIIELPVIFTGNEELGYFLMSRIAKFLTDRLKQDFYPFMMPD